MLSTIATACAGASDPHTLTSITTLDFPASACEQLLGGSSTELAEMIATSPASAKSPSV